ncbi:GntR family transcriptional regulator [Pseudonocardia yuanmonensis]|uniref:GntR family transcriptional regulator n=1 Tax=Pseudonocardia yuanmonensis TaxID=1095914 RepID=A0ABP8XNM9_9PSEU
MAAATEQTVTQLRRLIMEGELAPGSRLQEVELATQLGVSRTPVREALRTLSSEGLVEVLANRGARVARWSVEDLHEIYDLRIMLEAHAAERAAGRMHAAETDRLTELCEQMEACAQRSDAHDLLALGDLNTRFHRLIIDAADSPRLATMLGSVVHVPSVMRTFSRYTPDALARSMGHHRELTAAIRAGSPEWAGSVMRSHIIAARAALLGADLNADGTANSERGT